MTCRLVFAGWVKGFLKVSFIDALREAGFPLEQAHQICSDVLSRRLVVVDAPKGSDEEKLNALIHAAQTSGVFRSEILPPKMSP